MRPPATTVKLILFLLGYISLLIIIPATFPPDTTLPNVAARGGYNSQLAYLVIIAWSIIGLGYFAFSSRNQAEPICQPHEIRKNGVFLLNRPWLECLIVGVAAIVVYWPPFLARYGTYTEDTLFINILGRMQCGQLPYRDFEFLYGPLMIYPAHYWVNIVGYSLQNYYWLVAIMQGSVFAIAMRLFQSHLANPLVRYSAFLLFTLFIWDTLLGLSYIGWRVLMVLLAFVAAAARPRSVATSALAGCLIGLQIAYSHDYGIISYIAITMLYASNLIQSANRQTAIPVFVFMVSGIAVALAIIGLLTGSTFFDFTSSVKHVLGYAQETGIGNFRFYWTVNSIALFGLLAIAVVSVGSGLASIRHTAMNYGDRLFLGALLFALGALRIAIQRADIWHITLPFIPLLAVMLWQSPQRIFHIDNATRRIVWVLLVIVAVSRTIGLLPTGNLFVSGLLNGANDSLWEQTTSTETNLQGLNSRTYSIQTELSHPNPDITALGQYLADPLRADRPVFFYNKLWHLAAYVGVCPDGYSFYPLMYSDQHRPTVNFLEQKKETIVLMEASVYQRLFTNEFVEPVITPLSTTKKLASWTSSIHYQQKRAEAEIKFQVWKENVGDFLVEHYQRVHSIDEVIILERNKF
jgi:hypothetical protein